MWLPWELAAWLAVLALLGTVALRLAAPTRARGLRAFLQEGWILAALYALWQRSCDLPPGSTEQAVARGLDIVRLEHDLRLPSEEWVQQLALHSELLIRGANWYYVLAHAPTVGAVLVWLYGWHRTEFARWRTTLAFASIVSEVIQMLPVAPPRLALPGIVDTARVYGPSVYGENGTGFAPQLGAMPSLHCVWAIVVGLAVWQLARGPWRWLGPAHVVLTVLVIVVTGNHYWLDAVAAGLLVLLGLGVHEGGARLWSRLQGRPAAMPEPVAVSAG